MLAGFLTDHSESKKTPFLLGLGTMVASSLLFFLGEHIAITITARALQGLSASFVWVSGLAFLNSTLKAKNIGPAMGNVYLGVAIGEVLGPIVGGAMYEHAGHFAVMGLVCGILGLDIVLRMMLVEQPSTTQDMDDANDEDARQPLLNGQQRHAQPAKIEISYISILGMKVDGDLCASYYAACITGTIRYAFEAALVVFVSRRFGWPPAASGATLFAFLSPAILGPVVGKFTTNHGPRAISIVCFSIATLGLIALGFLTEPNTMTKAFFVAAVAVIGLCICTLVTVQSIAFSVAAKRRELKAEQEGWKESTGSMFGGFSMAWTVGMFVGPLAAEVFVDRVSWLAFCVFLAALSAVSAGVMTFTWKKWEVPDEE